MPAAASGAVRAATTPETVKSSGPATRSARQPRRTVASCGTASSVQITDSSSSVRVSDQNRSGAGASEMFERFVGEARLAALEATSVAAGLGSSSVEAEHLLISIASTSTRAGHALRGAGLEPQELRDATQRDFERVLQNVGIDATG